MFFRYDTSLDFPWTLSNESKPDLEMIFGVDDFGVYAAQNLGKYQDNYPTTNHFSLVNRKNIQEH